MTYNDTLYTGLLEEVRARPLLPNGTRELVDVAVNFDPRQRLTRAYEGYAAAELKWYLSQDLCIAGHKKIEDNPVWRRCATSMGMVNSNYGWCVFSEENNLQYQHALDALIHDKWTRQSCCIYTRPSIQLQHNDGLHATHDFICTFATQHLIRDRRLEYFVFMRSNDIATGLPYDLAWHQYMYQKMFDALPYTLEYGAIHWHATSLHLYEKVQA